MKKVFLIFGLLWTVMAWYAFGFPRPEEMKNDLLQIQNRITAEENAKITEEECENLPPVINVVAEEKVTATLYQPCVGQCDKTPLITADGSKINLKELERGRLKWIALSQDLIDSKDWNYGDTILVESGDSKIDGIYILHDTMNKRWKKRIDILILSRTKDFGQGVWRDVKISKISKV